MKRSNPFVKFNDYPHLTVEDIQADKIKKIKDVMQQFVEFSQFCERKNKEAAQHGHRQYQTLCNFVNTVDGNPIWYLASKSIDGKYSASLENYFAAIQKNGLKLFFGLLRGNRHSKNQYRTILYDAGADNQPLVEVTGIHVTQLAKKLIRESLLADYIKKNSLKQEPIISLNTNQFTPFQLPPLLPQKGNIPQTNTISSFLFKEEDNQNEVTTSNLLPAATLPSVTNHHAFFPVQSEDKDTMIQNNPPAGNEKKVDTDNLKKTDIAFILN